MDFMELAKKRYSVRAYKEKDVEQDIIAKVLEAGRIAPTGANRQSQQIFVVQGTALERLCKYTNLHGARLALIVCGDHNKAWCRSYDKKDTAEIDASIVCTHMMLEATQLGLGSLWVCSFDPIGVHKAFLMEASVEPFHILCLGYAKGESASNERFDKERNALEESVYYITK